MPDLRFTRLRTDPRFRRTRRKQKKVIIDDRFKSILAPPKLSHRSPLVDRYGRKLPKSHESDDLKRFYGAEGSSNASHPEPLLDYARGEILLESSDEEQEENQDLDADESDSDSMDLETSFFSSNAVDKSSFEAEDVVHTGHDVEVKNDIAPSHRLGVVNLDWDNIRSDHLFKICSSLLSPSTTSRSATNVTEGSGRLAQGRILSVRIYASNFGKGRMAREEIEGPPHEIFKKKSPKDEVINAQNLYQVGDKDEYDMDALRRYQLERLRYYYAIITCDTVATASYIYNELDGTELEHSANVFDLSYVPDDTEFDNDFRDETTQDNDIANKGINFVTDALRHSKVKLTWDGDDPERLQMTRRRLTKAEMEAADFRAYVASSSESETETQAISRGESREKLRGLLLGNNSDLPEDWHHDDNKGDIDMEITFTPGLSKQEDENILDRYKRKLREKRKKRKADVKEKVHKAQSSIPHAGSFFDRGSDGEGGNEEESSDKIERKRYVGSTSDGVTRSSSSAEELALLATSNNPTGEANHFNLKSVLKAEKSMRRKKGKKIANKESLDAELQPDFKIDLNDGRFRALHENPQFAIDPTNPHFTKTISMNALLRERSRQQGIQSEGTTSKSEEMNGERSLNALVASVKRKNIHPTGVANKRRKVSFVSHSD